MVNLEKQINAASNHKCALVYELESYRKSIKDLNPLAKGSVDAASLKNLSTISY